MTADVVSLAHARADRIIRQALADGRLTRQAPGGLIETSRLPWTGRQFELGLDERGQQSRPATAERHSDD